MMMQKLHNESDFDEKIAITYKTFFPAYIRMPDDITMTFIRRKSS